MPLEQISGLFVFMIRNIETYMSKQFDCSSFRAVTAELLYPPQLASEESADLPALVWATSEAWLAQAA